jgi:hypothetical protein
MNVKTISVTYDRKQNLGDFSSVSVGVTLWADLQGGETEEQALAILLEKAKDVVLTDLRGITAKVVAQKKLTISGLPADLRALVQEGVE